MMLSKGRVAGGNKAKPQEKKLPDLDEFLAKRDYMGAITLLQFQCPEAISHLSQGDGFDTGMDSSSNVHETCLWLAYAHYHYGEHDKALKIYLHLLRLEETESSPQHSKNGTSCSVLNIYVGACLYYLGRFEEAESYASKGPASRLRTRLLFHCAHKMGKETELMEFHQQLSDSIEDQLSLAAMHFLRTHYQEATDIYKKVLMENREFLALNVYIALCYCKLDYYDVSLEILQAYLQTYSDSSFAINLKACNHFRLYNGRSAESEMKTLHHHNGGNSNGDNALVTRSGDGDGDQLIKHNTVVFRNGDGAMLVLPNLVDVLPEARLNLVIYHLKHGEVDEAFKLVDGIEPSNPQEYILKAVVLTITGQDKKNAEHLQTAQHHFQLVGASASECDTIPGRQCMSSCYFLQKQFEDVLVYLKSIKSYFADDDDFNWNFGIACAANGEYKTGEEALTGVMNENYKHDFCYLSWLAKCYIMNNKARLAWELYLGVESSSNQVEDSYQLLHFVASECYLAGSFYYAAKAFDVLERMDPNPDYWQGKRGACIGVFRDIVEGKESRDRLKEVMSMLRYTSNPQVEHIIRVMTNWETSEPEMQ